MRARVEIQAKHSVAPRRKYRSPPPRTLMAEAAVPRRMRLFRDPDGGINWYHVLSAAGWATFAVAVVGELLGWWDPFGEIVGAAGIGVGVLGSLFNAGRTQVRGGFQGVTHHLGRIETRLEKLDKLDKLDGLDGMDAKLDAHTELLREIRDILRDMRDQRPAG
ncbi:MAG TPA: hypothetical protein VGR28_12290 [Candidatus Thermoplasmatota archaeon]|nr:hypothetical protein [Candidatus Thermoplasmatota archaeon]